MQVAPKWRVIFGFEDREEVILFIADNHIQNVLRQLATMNFVSKITGIDILLEKES